MKYAISWHGVHAIFIIGSGILEILGSLPAQPELEGGGSV
jgi:hypothetical protein